MVDKDVFAERGRALEEEYFRKKDRELVDKMRQAAAAEQARADMGTKTGLTDPAMLKDLEELGFTPDTVALLPLVPVVQMAWAEGGVTPAERAMIAKLAHARGIEPGSAADRQLTSWLDHRPAEHVFVHATRLIRAMLDASPQGAGFTADELVRYCESIADASGGFLGINKVSADEKEILASLAGALKSKQVDK
jgi:hypothetical protein